MGLLASTSIDQLQQQIFAHSVLDNHSLDVIDLTSEDVVMNSYYSIENDEEIDETHFEVRIYCITTNYTLPIILNIF